MKRGINRPGLPLNGKGREKEAEEREGGGGEREGGEREGEGRGEGERETTIRIEVRPRLIRMKLGINRPGLPLNGRKREGERGREREVSDACSSNNSINIYIIDIVAIGQAVRSIKAEADKSLPFVPSRPPPQFMPSPADKLEALKIVVGNSIDGILIIYLLFFLLSLLPSLAPSPLPRG